MKHIFEIGSKVLCFEPNESKEKLIYHAKIVSHGGFERHTPLYRVHFEGWNSKWDREVSQNLLLPLTDFNLNLKKKIDEIARNERVHSIRHDLVDEVLEIASEAVDDDDFDWNSIDEHLKKLRNKYKSPKPKQQCERSFSNESSTKIHIDNDNLSNNNNNNNQTVDKCLSDNLDAVSDIEKSLFSKENDSIHMTFCPKISLTERQLEVLEQDERLSAAASLSPPLPTVEEETERHASTPCVTEILERYLEVFPHRDCRLPSWRDFQRFPHRHHPDSDDGDEHFCESPSCEAAAVRLPQWPDPELSSSYLKADLSSQLCLEFCSGLRVLFDSYVRSRLLCEHEWSRHDFLVQQWQLTDSTVSRGLPQGDTDSKQRSVSKERPLKLVPEQFRHHKLGFQPSLHYGCTHLLRLLHEIPSILVKMSLTRASFTVVMRHCYCLIKYLDLHYTDFNNNNNNNNNNMFGIKEDRERPPRVSKTRITRKKTVNVCDATRRSLRSSDIVNNNNNNNNNVTSRRANNRLSRL